MMAPRFKISLSQWSLHRTLQSGKLDHLNFARKAAAMGIYAIEYVNQFFKDKAQDNAYLSEMNLRSKDFGVRQLLIMIDGEGVWQRSMMRKEMQQWTIILNGWMLRTSSDVIRSG